MGRVIGIDLGTTFSSAAALIDGRPTLIPNEQGQFFGLFVEDFANGERIIFTEGLLRQLVQEIDDASGIREHIVDMAQTVSPVYRIIPERKRLFNIDDGINAETCQTFVQPPVDHLIDFLAQFGILPV